MSGTGCLVRRLSLSWILYFMIIRVLYLFSDVFTWKNMNNSERSWSYYENLNIIMSIVDFEDLCIGRRIAHLMPSQWRPIFFCRWSNFIKHKNKHYSFNLTTNVFILKIVPYIHSNIITLTHLHHFSPIHLDFTLWEFTIIV